MMRLSPALPLQPRRPPRAVPATTITHATMPSVATDMAIGDWHDLLRAVTDRLRQAPGAAEVVECVAALDQLSATLQQEIGGCRRQRIEAQAALAYALDEFAGTRDEQLYARHLALHDSLTSLPSREVFVQRLDHALRNAASKQHAVAVFYLGLEGVNGIDSSPRCAVGDELLWAVGARLARAVRAEDLVSHFGLDEFACLLIDAPDREALSRLACKLFDLLSAPLQIGAHAFCVRPSIGIATGAATCAGTAAWLSQADSAMVHARTHGLGHAYFGDCANVPLRQAALL